MIVGILLAAGIGRRFGDQKLLCPLADGIPMVVGAARNLQSAVDRVLAVVRRGENRVARLLEAQGVDVIACPRADEGMGSSLAWGVRATLEADGWLIALGDMPFIRSRTHQRVAEELARGALLAAPAYQGRRGHPVGFAGVLGPELCRLNGDRGARSLVRRYRGELILLSCRDPGVVYDIDVPGDLRPERVPVYSSARINSCRHSS